MDIPEKDEVMFKAGAVSVNQISRGLKPEEDERIAAHPNDDALNYGHGN